MAKLTRLNCFILMYITISHSSGFPQEDERSRMFFGCSSDTKQTLSECLGKCTEVSCHFKELQNFLSACKSGTKLTCTTAATTPITTTPPIPLKCDCGKANTATARRLGGSTTKGKTTKRKPSKQTRRRPSKPNRGTPSESTRIIGGVRVKPPRKYPWQVLLQVVSPAGFGTCGGSIINNRWILTAAHCLGSSTINLLVRVGEHIRSMDRDDDPVNTRYYNVKRQVPHPDYDGRNNDFALLELTEEIPFNNIIRPVCLPEDDSKTYAGVIATASGWGNTISGDDDSGSDVLMEVDVTIDAQSDCRGWGNLPVEDEDTGVLVDTEPVTDVMLCAGPVVTPSPGKDTCQGDSGGPLVVKEGNIYVQVGVVSFGIGCGTDPQGPFSAIYARVSKQLEWIRKITASGEC